MAVNVSEEKPAQIEQEKVLLKWTAKSRPFNPKGMQTRQVLVVLGVLVTMILVFAKEWMLLVVLAAGAFYYYAVNHVPPEEAEYQITNKGIRAYGRLFMWWEFSHWWWIEKGTIKMIGMEIPSGVLGSIFVPIERRMEKEVEDILNKYVLYEVPTETMLDKVGRWVAEKFPLENKI